MRRKELVKLVAGFRRFRQRYYEGENPVFDRLSQGQSPKTLVIACSDSRVDPAIITDASPGEIFVIRNVANLVPPFEKNGGFHGVSSAIEFAVVNLKVNNIIILGHRHCGGIRALMTGLDNPAPSFIQNWMNIAASAKETVMKKYAGSSSEDLHIHCEHESIRISIRNLKTFPFVERAIKERGMNIIGAYFDLDEGHLLEMNEVSGEFTALI